MGIGSERLHLAWVSSAEAQRFVDVAKEVTASIEQQGKFDAAAMAFELNAAEMTLAGDVVRWLVGKEVKITSQGDVYGRSWDVDRFESILDAVVAREYHKNMIYLAIKEGAASIRDIHERTGLELKWISRLVADMEKRSLVEFKGMEDNKPVFAVS